MAQTAVQGSVSLFEISRDGGTTWKYLVCEQSNNFNGTADTTEESTKCATFIGIKKPKYEAGGSGVVNITPDDGEISYKEMQEIFDTNEEVNFRLESPVIGVIAKGAGYHHSGKGFFDTLNITSEEGSLVKFDWSFKVNGNISRVSEAPPESYGTTLDFAAATSDTGGGITVTVAEVDAQQKFEFNIIASPSGLPQSMSITVDGEEEATIDFPMDYLGEYFLYTDKAGNEHIGIFANTTVAFTTA